MLSTLTTTKTTMALEQNATCIPGVVTKRDGGNFPVHIHSTNTHSPESHKAVCKAFLRSRGVKGKHELLLFFSAFIFFVYFRWFVFPLNQFGACLWNTSITRVIYSTPFNNSFVVVVHFLLPFLFLFACVCVCVFLLFIPFYFGKHNCWMSF